MPVTLKQVFFTFVSDSLVKSWKKRLLTIVIDTDTEYQIEYVTLINDLKFYDEDREMTLRIKIKDIITEVSREDRNPEREYCLNWCTADKISIKGH